MTIRERQKNPRDGTASVSARARDRAIEKAVAPLRRRIDAIERKLSGAPRRAVLKTVRRG